MINAAKSPGISKGAVEPHCPSHIHALREATARAASRVRACACQSACAPPPRPKAYNVSTMYPDRPALPLGPCEVSRRAPTDCPVKRHNAGFPVSPQPVTQRRGDGPSNMIVKSEMVFPTGTFEWMVVRFVRVIRVPACARVSRVSRVCPGSLRCLFTGTVPILTKPIPLFVCAGVWRFTWPRWPHCE